MARKLTPKQAEFVDYVTGGIRRTPAAKAAGFKFPARDAYRLMQLPHVVEALRERREATINGDLATLAVETIRDLMAPETPAATRYQAAKWTLEHAGHGAEQADQGPAKTLDEMDAEELAHAVTSGMDALRELAGQLEGHHVVDGQVRQVQLIEGERADFLE